MAILPTLVNVAHRGSRTMYSDITYECMILQMILNDIIVCWHQVLNLQFVDNMVFSVQILQFRMIIVKQ